MGKFIIDAHSHLWLKQDTWVEGKRILSLKNGREDITGGVEGEGGKEANGRGRGPRTPKGKREGSEAFGEVEDHPEDPDDDGGGDEGVHGSPW